MSTTDHDAARRAVHAFLVAIGAPVGADPELEGTPDRVVEAWSKDFLSGYAMDPARLFRDATQSSSTAVVVLRGIEATTMCPHHLLPASGRIHVGYWPGTKVAGFGAIAALVDGHTRRLALQEDIARNVAEALVEHLGAKAAACMVDLVPTCATARGERRHGLRAVATSYAGRAEHEPALRAEFLATLGVTEAGER
jgi:GTP cyclohydrolase I